VLRRDASAASEQLTICYPDQSFDIELACGSRVVWSGALRWEVRRDDQVLAPTSSWRSTCWVSDGDCDYLELEIELGAGICMERQIVLARKDRFLFLADALLGDQPGRLEYCATLPMAAGVEFRGAKESREGSLCASRAKRNAERRLATVLPLALPEWRCDERVGELTATSEGLELRQAAFGKRLFSPLFVDLDPRRLGRELTWRQLTVAQTLVAQPVDVAVGYRVAVGKRQWLIYRSLAPKANRTVLGHNLSSESLVARFDKKGEVESIIEID